MTVRTATPDDAPAMLAIYAPIVATSATSFELTPPDEAEMRQRIASTLTRLPWLVDVDDQGRVDDYAYAAKHRDRAACQWTAEVSTCPRPLRPFDTKRAD